MQRRLDELSRQLNNANDELSDLCTTFGQITSYNELLVRENAELKHKLKGKGQAHDDDKEPEDQTNWQPYVIHSSEEHEKVEEETAGLV